MGEHRFREFSAGERPGDLEVLLDAYLEIFQDANALASVSQSLRPFERDALREWFEEHDALCVVCEDDETGLVGFQVAVPDPLVGFELWGAAVRPAAQRGGIATRLVECAVERAASLGYRAVDSLVFADNVARLRQLLGQGFVPVELRHRVRADGGDLVRLRRAVVPGA